MPQLEHHTDMSQKIRVVRVNGQITEVKQSKTKEKTRWVTI